MRTRPLLTAVPAGALLVLTLSTGTALAAPDPGPTGGAAEPGAVSVSPSSAAPGSAVRISGTCPTGADGSGDPTVESVTSDAFTGPESFSTTDPTAFDGTATIASGASAGAHTVLLTCSNGTASTTVTVTGSSTPAPSGSRSGSGTGSAGAAPGAGTGGGAGVLPGPEDGSGGAAGAGGGDAAAVAVDTRSGSGTPWGWITAGGLVAAGTAAGGTYALTRRRGSAAGTPARRPRR